MKAKRKGKGRAPAKELKQFIPSTEGGNLIKNCVASSCGNRTPCSVSIYGDLLNIVKMRADIESIDGEKAWTHQREIATAFKAAWKSLQNLEPLPRVSARRETWRHSYSDSVARWIMAFQEPMILKLLMRLLSAVERRDAKTFEDIARMIEQNPTSAVAWPEAQALLVDQLTNGGRPICLREANGILKPFKLRVTKTRFFELRKAIGIPAYRRGEKPSRQMSA